MITFFFIVLGIIIFIKLLVRFSTLRIDIKELEILNKKINKFKIKLSLNLFNKIQWIKITIDKNRIKKLKNSKRLQAINKVLNTSLIKKYNNIRMVLVKQWKQILKQLKTTQLEKFSLEAVIGTERADITAYTTSAILIILPILLCRNTSDLSYKVKPVYINRNYIYVSLNCIFSLKLVHIISVKKELKRKEVDQYGRTSNRKSYVDSNG